MLIGIDASPAPTRHRTGTAFYSLRLAQALLALETGHRFRVYLNRPSEDPNLFWPANMDSRTRREGGMSFHAAGTTPGWIQADTRPGHLLSMAMVNLGSAAVRTANANQAPWLH